MNISKGLNYLGFPNADFVLQDDGAGAYIRDWNSSEPKPTMADIEAAVDEWVLKYEVEQTAKQDRISSVKTKLEAIGLTTEEIQEAFGI